MAWWVWLLIALVLGVIELSSVTFVLLWLAVAALLTTFLTPIVQNVWAQLVVFAIASVVLFVATRPLARKWRASTKKYPSRLETMVNKTGIVVTSGGEDTLATVRIQGELWSAEAVEDLRVGDHVIVKSATAAVLMVEPMRRNDL
ncbi:MAG: hypothetical protein A2201_13060 [Alicyclobacillus sp. RIFOXYA1_FULL_53_8]|nr:MAG: hypothetical protein A2201_13060 [Alicyclobacillus sp. RIFOXYA1_FULL_53_8]